MEKIDIEEFKMLPYQKVKILFYEINFMTPTAYDNLVKFIIITMQYDGYETKDEQDFYRYNADKKPSEQSYTTYWYERYQNEAVELLFRYTYDKGIGQDPALKVQQKKKEKRRERQKEYREENKEKIAEKQKEYRERNKEKIAVKKKERYEKNKEKIAEKVHCDVCNCDIRKDNFKRHEQTKKHLKNLG
jgi:hypothetical protein